MEGGYEGVSEAVSGECEGEFGGGIVGWGVCRVDGYGVGCI